MAKLKDKFKVGQKVRALRSHNKSVEIVGEVVKLHENDDDCLDIKLEPDGALETVHAADVKDFDDKSDWPKS